MKLFRCKKGEKEVNNQRSNKLSKQPTGRKYSIYFWAAVSFCLIFYGTSSTSIEHFDENSLKNILNSIGQAIISGLVITFIINIPDMFSYFQKVLYKTITSDEYLEQLTLEEVEDLKNSCTKLISKSIPDIAEGLLELEYKIVEYYRSPYYENYSTFVSCSRDGNYLVKDITTEYTLKNPMAGKEKIEAIVGLDMAVPAYYDEMDISIPMMKLGHYGAVLGITRWIPSLAESDAIKYGTLSEKEKEIYRAVFYQRTATETMIDEAKVVKDNANIVKENGIPQVPMLLFISNGSGGTGFTKEKGRSIPENYISGHDNTSYIELDCPHYVHDYKYKEISQEIRSFIK